MIDVIADDEPGCPIIPDGELGHVGQTRPRPWRLLVRDSAGTGGSLSVFVPSEVNDWRYDTYLFLVLVNGFERGGSSWWIAGTVAEGTR